MHIIWLPPGNMSQIIQIIQVMNMSALKYLDHCSKGRGSTSVDHDLSVVWGFGAVEESDRSFGTKMCFKTRLENFY